MKLLFLQFGVIMWGLLAWSSRAEETQNAFDENISTMIQGKGNAEMEQEGGNNHNRILRQAKQYSENDVEPFNVFSGSTNYNQENKYHRPPLQKQYARYEPPSPLDKINGGVVMREMVDEPMIRALDSLRGEAFGITRRFDLLDQSHPMRYYRKLIESRGLRPRPKAIFDEIDRVGIQGFGKRNDQSDKGELRNFEKKNFDEVDKSGFRDFGKRNFDEIDKSGFGDFGKRNFDEVDKSGFRDFGKRNFDEIDKSGFGDFGKRNFDEIDKSGFRDFGKRNFHEAEKSGFRGSRKRNFDEVDKSGFRDFGKRNFDEIDQAGFRDFGKRSINQAEIGEAHLRKVKKSELRETENEGAKIKSISNQMRSNGTRNSQQGEI